jgi:hypothetical protein
MKARAMTREAKRNAHLAAVSCVFALLYALSFLADAKKPQSVTSALLNETYSKTITRVELSAAKKGETAVLQKGASFWTHEQGGLLTPVRREYIDSLLNGATRIRSMTIIQGKEADYAAYGLDEDSAFRLAFVDNAGKTAAELYFGDEDYTARRVAVRSSAKNAMYWIEKDTAPRLTAVREFWADTRLIPGFMAGDSDAAGTIQKAVLALVGEQARVLNVPKENYGALVSLRAVRTVPRAPPVATLLALLRVEFADGAVLELRITPLDDLSGEFLAVPAFTGGALLSDAETARLNYALVISAWTLNRLKELCAADESTTPP